MMIPRVAVVDKRGMADNDLLFDMLNEQNLLVLHAYSNRSLAAKAADDDHDGWLQRMEPNDQLDGEQLTQIHGELIALGMLKFELSNRETGLRYCVSERGKSTLERQSIAFTSQTSSSSVDADPAADSQQVFPLADAA